MTEYDINPKAALPKLDRTLERVLSPITDVNSPYVLVPNPTVEAVHEFQSQRLDSHILMFDASGNVAKEHSTIKERTDCAFPDIRVGEHTILLVPDGARSLRQIVPLLSRNIDAYSEIFDQLGSVLRDLSDAQVGLPSNHDLLSHFAFAADEDSVSGGKVYLIPPYSLEDTQDVDRIIEKLDEELATTTDLTEEQLGIVLAKVNHGWSKIG